MCQPIFPMISKISPRANAFPKLSFFTICTMAIAIMIPMKKVRSRPTINKAMARIQLTASRGGNAIPGKTVKIAMRMKGAMKMKGTIR